MYSIRTNIIFRVVVTLMITFLVSGAVSAAEVVENDRFDKEGFAKFQSVISGLNGCYKPVGKNAKLLEWGKIVITFDPEIDCSPDGASCTGEIILFDRANVQSQSSVVQIVGNNIAVGHGFLIFQIAEGTYTNFLISRFKPDLQNKIVAFESAMPGTVKVNSFSNSGPRSTTNKSVIFESCEMRDL